MNLTNEEILNIPFPNRELKQQVFNQQLQEMDQSDLFGYQEEILASDFSSVRDMLAHMLNLEKLAEDKFLTEVLDDNSNVSLPLFGTSVSCGFLGPADDSIEKNLSLDAHLVKHPAATFFVRAAGDCMNPSIIDNDLLIIDRSLEASYGKIVLAILDGEFTVKRLVQEAGGIILRPDNPSFNDIVINEERDFKIWGVVTYIIHQA